MTILEKLNLLGAGLALAIYILCILVFLARLINRPELGQKLGTLLMLAAFPLLYLLWKAPQYDRPVLYFIQIGLMLVYLTVTLALDYIWEFDFRQIRWMVISYVTLFFAATGGMLGVAALAGRSWMFLAVILFLIMAFLAFVQRAVTGI